MKIKEYVIPFCIASAITIAWVSYDFYSFKNSKDASDLISIVKPMINTQDKVSILWSGYSHKKSDEDAEITFKIEADGASYRVFAEKDRGTWKVLDIKQE